LPPEIAETDKEFDSGSVSLARRLISLTKVPSSLTEPASSTPDGAWLLWLADEVTVQSAVIAPVVKVDPDREPPKQPDTDKLV
jgi:hypothetical protein